MRHAKLENSARLQRVLAVLEMRQRLDIAKGWIGTRQIVRLAHVCAVNSCISELRANGAKIACEQRREKGQMRFYYRLERAPEGWDG